MKLIRIESSHVRVANLLKKYINSKCEGAFTWFDEIGEMPTITDMLYTIDMLDRIGPTELIEDLTETEEIPADIEDLGFTVKTFNKLTTNGITTTIDLCEKSIDDLQQLKGVGAGMINEILTVLSTYGIELRTES